MDLKKNIIYTLNDIKYFYFSPQFPLPNTKTRMRVGPFMDPNHYIHDASNWVKTIAENINLSNTKRILDIGCGTGRLFYPLKESLPNIKLYEGLDINSQVIKWAKNNINDKIANFTHFDMFNSLYNPNGSKISKLKLPYGDKKFDLILVQSVFTHLLFQDVGSYIGEIKRILTSDGRLISTYFFIENLKNKKNINGFQFKHKIGKSFVNDRNVKEAAVAYKKKDIVELYKDNDLKIIKNLVGNWSINDGRQYYQDILFAKKK